MNWPIRFFFCSWWKTKHQKATCHEDQLGQWWTTFSNLKTSRVSHSPSRVKMLPGQGAALCPVLWLAQSNFLLIPVSPESQLFHSANNHSPLMPKKSVSGPTVMARQIPFCIKSTQWFLFLSHSPSLLFSLCHAFTTRKLSFWNPASKRRYKQWPVRSKGRGNPGWGLGWICAHTVTWEQFPVRGQSGQTHRESPLLLLGQKRRALQ